MKSKKIKVRLPTAKGTILYKNRKRAKKADTVGRKAKYKTNKAGGW